MKTDGVVWCLSRATTERAKLNNGGQSAARSSAWLSVLPKLKSLNDDSEKIAKRKTLELR